MTTNQSLISVIFPVYNAGEYLSECLEKLLQQTHKNIEIIAIDDFSSDNSFEILKKFKKKDKRLHISKNVKHYGMALTLNRCIKQMKGTLVAFMNAKDISNKDRFHQQIVYLQENQQAVAVGVQCAFINKNKVAIGVSEFPTENAHMYKKPLDGVTMLFENIMIHRHRIPKDILHFNTNKYPFIYTDIVIKLLNYGKIHNLSTVLYTKRIFTQQKSHTPSIHFPYLAKIWFRAATVYDNNVSFRSLLLNPLLASLK